MRPEYRNEIEFFALTALVLQLFSISLFAKAANVTYTKLRCHYCAPAPDGLAWGKGRVFLPREGNYRPLVLRPTVKQVFTNSRNHSSRPKFVGGRTGTLVIVAQHKHWRDAFLRHSGRNRRQTSSAKLGTKEKNLW
jgi:hypothetical protein